MGERSGSLSAENVEIERKFIIVRPCEELLSGYGYSEILQTYLKSSPAVTHRVRSRSSCGVTVYTETKKIRIDKMSSFEDEREITCAEYEELLKLADSDATPVCKRRYLIPHGEYILEIDVYPQWDKTCVMEVELPSRESEVSLPPFISVIKEVTGDKRYSNASMSRCFPDELHIE